MNIPNHVAIVLDGNGRWAAKRHMPRNYGHMQGSKAVERICEDAYDLGIKYLTVYAFSTENWSRPQDEVTALMNLLRSYLKDCIKRSTKNNMKVRVLGEKSRLNDDIREKIAELEEISKNNTGLNFQVALNYGGRDDIIRAAGKFAEDCIKGTCKPEDLSEQLFDNYLDTKGIPAPDLLIRTSGEQRISNFMIWQLAYSELYFTDVLWPDFKKKDLEEAIEYYSTRERRFGGIGK